MSFPNSGAFKIVKSICSFSKTPLSTIMIHTSCFYSPIKNPQDPRHLQLIASFTDGDVYSLLTARKLHGAPTDFGLCVKVLSLPLVQTVSSGEPGGSSIASVFKRCFCFVFFSPSAVLKVQFSA